MSDQKKLVEPSYLEYKGKYKGIFSWIFSTDHKRIGLLYLFSILSFFVIGATIGLLMKFELIAPGKTVMTAQTYNAFFTLHGIIMIFAVVIPGLPAVFGNFMLPLMIGAKDVAFPRLNLLSWYFYVTGVTLVLISQFLGQGPPDTGWTFYAPYSFRTPGNMLPAVFGAFVLGFSSILTGLNFLVTIHRLRAPGMTWLKMPLFPWTLYATGWVQLLATPIIGITLLMIVAERIFHIGFFDPTLGGDPILFQHLFWTYSHPAVYIMILPAMGAISEIIPTFSHKTVFGYKFIVGSSLAIAFVGYFVWGHHMFTSGMSSVSLYVFSLLTFLVAIPSAIKVFNWISTMHKGSIDHQTPLYWAVAFIFVFMIGGFSGLVLGSLAADIHLHNTHFVLAHFHFIVFGGTGYAFFGAMHYWYPKITGKMYDSRWANIGLVLFLAGFITLYGMMFYLGFKGMPRRYYDYDEMFHFSNVISTMGSWVMYSGLAIIIINLFASLRSGIKAPSDPWGGKTLEWTIPSPPPPENFEEIPVVTKGPYNYK
ncbi:MAG TPA: cbb3-type cytochrome c oxidase subunit I [Bacteroidales bacterium]|jgi:cytochrome c oxidase subunit 1|nr:cbb3-type cytochrome c oxidase subunit I [Bacteroidales bacterium]